MAFADKFLLLGASGNVGRAVWSMLGPERAVATCNRTPVPGAVPFDVTRQRITTLVEPGQFRHAVVLLADSQPDSCIKDPAVSHRLNVASMKVLLGDLMDLGIIPIFASTEFVFDGEKGNYAEEDPAHPILLYGRQKLEVEQWLQADGRPHAILRFAKVYGTDPNDGTPLSAMAHTLLNAKGPLRCAVDQAFSPIHNADVLEAILKVMENDAHGLFHLAGPRRLTRMEWMRMMAAALARHRPLNVSIEACSIHDFPLLERRPVDVSMRIDRLTSATRFIPSDPEMRCDEIARRFAEAR